MHIRSECRWTFIIAAICGIVGVLVTYFFVPDMTGVDLADEDAKWLLYLAESGWDGEVGDEGNEAALTERLRLGEKTTAQSRRGRMSAA